MGSPPVDGERAASRLPRVTCTQTLCEIPARRPGPRFLRARTPCGCLASRLASAVDDHVRVEPKRPVATDDRSPYASTTTVLDGRIILGGFSACCIIRHARMLVACTALAVSVRALFPVPGPRHVPSGS